MPSSPRRSRVARATRAALVTTIALVVVQVVVLLVPSVPGPGQDLATLEPTGREVVVAMSTPFVGFALLTVVFLVLLVLVETASGLLVRGRGRHRS